MLHTFRMAFQRLLSHVRDVKSLGAKFAFRDIIITDNTSEPQLILFSLQPLLTTFRLASLPLITCENYLSLSATAVSFHICRRNLQQLLAQDEHLYRTDETFAKSTCVYMANNELVHGARAITYY